MLNYRKQRTTSNIIFSSTSLLVDRKLKVESRRQQQNTNDCEKYLNAMRSVFSKGLTQERMFHMRKMFCAVGLILKGNPLAVILISHVWSYFETRWRS